MFVCFLTEEILLYHGSLRSRELGQAPMLLVFLPPRRALSSHLRVFIIILWESMNFHPDQQLFQVAGAGIEPPTLGLQVQRSPPTPRGNPK